jgi:ribosomal protein S25
MPRLTRQSNPSKNKTSGKFSTPDARASVSAAAAFSFLKETKGLLTWTPSDLAKSLKISLAEAKQVLAALEIQGYIKQHGTGEWLTTLAGETVSGAKTPRFTPESIEEALAALRSRIKLVNQDPKAPYKITDAAAFGDFLSAQARAQAADVGIQLVRRKSEGGEHSKKEQMARLAFLKQLRGKTQMLNIVPYQEWMGSRSHRSLLRSK